LGFGIWDLAFGIDDSGELLIFSASNIHQICVDDSFRITVRLDNARIQPECLVAEPRHQIQRVRHKEDGAAAAAKFRKLVETLVRERLVAHRKHFVDEQDIGIDVDRHCKTEAHVHAGRVGLHRRVDKFVELRKPDDLVESIGDLATTEAQHQSIDVDVLATRYLRVKSGT